MGVDGAGFEKSLSHHSTQYQTIPVCTLITFLLSPFSL